MNYWLLKTEPGSFSIEDLRREGTTSWDGVRNYQARNHLRAMKPGDVALIHHSSIKEPAVVGVGKIIGEAYPDKTQFDSKSSYFDPSAKREVPRWIARKVAFKSLLKRAVTLNAIKTHPLLQKMLVAKRGIRLSVQ